MNSLPSNVIASVATATNLLPSLTLPSVSPIWTVTDLVPAHTLVFGTVQVTSIPIVEDAASISTSSEITQTNSRRSSISATSIPLSQESIRSSLLDSTLITGLSIAIPAISTTIPSTQGGSIPRISASIPTQVLVPLGSALPSLTSQIGGLASVAAGAISSIAAELDPAVQSLTELPTTITADSSTFGNLAQPTVVTTASALPDVSSLLSSADVFSAILPQNSVAASVLPSLPIHSVTLAGRPQDPVATLLADSSAIGAVLPSAGNGVGADGRALNSATQSGITPSSTISVGQSVDTIQGFAAGQSGARASSIREGSATAAAPSVQSDIASETINVQQIGNSEDPISSLGAQLASPTGRAGSVVSVLAAQASLASQIARESQASRAALAAQISGATESPAGQATASASLGTAAVTVSAPAGTDTAAQATVVVAAGAQATASSAQGSSSTSSASSGNIASDGSAVSSNAPASGDSNDASASTNDSVDGQNAGSSADSGSNGASANNNVNGKTTLAASSGAASSLTAYSSRAATILAAGIALNFMF